MPRISFIFLLTAAALDASLAVSAQQPRPRREFTGAREAIRNIAFSPDGRFLAAGIFAAEVRVWDVASGKQVLLLEGRAGPSIAVAFSPDGKRLVTTGGNNGTLTLWDLPAGKKRSTLARDPNPFVHHVAFSPDGKWIASGGSEVRVWDAATGKNLHARTRTYPRGVCAVCFSPDSKRLVSTEHGGELALWDVGTGKQLRVWKLSGVVAGLAFSRDGSRLYCGSNDGSIHECDAADGKKLRAWTTNGKGGARTLSLSPDGHSLAVSTASGAVQVWELATSKQRRTFAAGHGFAWAVAFAPDGKSIATAGEERVVRLWDVTAGWAEPDADKRKPPTEKQQEAYWKDLGGEAGAAFTAIWALSAHGKHNLPLLAKKLETVETPLTAKQIARLIEQFDDDSFRVREKASEVLSQEGGLAVRRALEAATKSGALEQSRRAAKLLAQRTGGGPSHREVILLRVAEVMEKIDSPDARKILGRISK